MQLIDTHAHLTFPEIETQVEDVLARSREAGVDRWITIGTDPEQIEKTIELARRHDNMWAAVGVHPHHASEVDQPHLDRIRELAADPKVVAIGEAGLDYHYELSVRDKQKEVFRAQLQIAADTNLPIVVHTRKAFEDSMEILDEFAGKLKNVVIHCYSGTPEQTQQVLDRGFYISFTGIVTFKRTDDVREVAKMVPLDRMMIETDTPYISPEPVRKQKPNEPALMIHTAKLLANLHGLPLETFAQKVTATSEKFFNLA
ncbi:putative deoxyribonuclease YcfH [Anaerohalosphaera lusitana]|uniref:Putative deoxyribonuclease YcfH n=1 Tax=Anaerohalosphaera lusitana TaxID=1936003 RepID=A0A1U9NQ75_9BACT|nr:TatD family hydrolase [Anaerohalosphaera lusitana]AQT69884.1 putative deoxyribonuclease YcfH [Anaerohalosphaera lusitana]